MNQTPQVISFNDHSQKTQVIAMTRASELYFRARLPGDSIGASAVRSGSWVLFAQAIGTLVRIVSSIMLARLLMPADFGLFAILVAVSSGLIIFKDLGLCDAIIQWQHLSDRQISTLFWVNLGISVAVAGCFMVVSPLLSRFYREPRLIGIIVVWSLTIIFGALSSQHLALLKREMLFSGASKLAMIAAMISNIGAVALAWLGANYWALVLREVINEAMIAVGAWFLCRWRPQKPSRYSGIRPMLIFGGQSIISFIIRRTTRNFDRILLGWKFGPVITGHYHMAFELVAIFTALTVEPLRNVAVSSLSKLREHPERFKQHYLKAIRGVAFVCFAAAAAIIVESGDIVAIFWGPKWQRAGNILCVLGVSAAISPIYMTNIWLHFSLGRADRMVWWSIVEALLICAAVTSGLYFGVIGVAWGYSVSMCLLCVIGLWYAGRPISLTLRQTIGAFWQPAIAAIIAACLCWYVVLTTGIAHSNASRLVLFCASFGGVYALFLVILGGGIASVRRSIELLKNYLPARSPNN